MPDKGKLIALEGADDQALDSQAESLYRWLQGSDVAVEKTREPTNGPVGTQIHYTAREGSTLPQEASLCS